MFKKPILAGLLALSLAASPAHALDLMEAYEAALVNDPTFRAAIKDAEAGRANLEIGRSGLLPQLSASYYTAQNQSKIAQPAFGNLGGPTIITDRFYPSNNSFVQATQVLFNLQALAQFRQGTAQANLANARLLYNSQDLLIRVLQAYTDLLYAQDQHAFLVAQRNALKEQLSVNERRFARGEGTVTDALETRAQFELSNAQVIEARDAIENAKRKLEAIIGSPLSSAEVVKRLQQFKIVPLVPKNFDYWQETALLQNPEIQAVKHAEEVARQDFQKNIAGNYPVVSAIASYGQQNSYFISTINQNAVTTTVGIQATLPIFNGGQTTGLISQSRANFEKAQAQSDEARLRVITELRKQYDAVLSSEQKLAALNRAVESSQLLIKAMRQSVKGGERINLDVLVADRTLATAQRDLAQAKYNYLLASLRLRQQAGTLTVEDLQKVAENFQRSQNMPPARVIGGR